MRRFGALACAVLIAAIPGLVAAQNPRPEFHVGPGRFGDGELKSPRLDNTGSVVVTEGGGKYSEPTRRGQAFIYSTAAAGVLLAAVTTTFFGPMLWNPCGSGRDLHITKIVVGDVSGTTVRGHIAYATLTGAGSTVATGAPILTGTFVAPRNAYIGSGITSAMLWSPAAGTYTTAPVYLAPAFNLGLVGAAPNVPVWVDDVDGRIIIAPCNAFFVAGNAAITLTAVVAIYGIEVPVPLSNVP